MTEESTTTGDAAEGQEQQAAAQSNSEEVKTFTQAELDEILKKRVKRERDKYADYGELKAAADKLAEIEEANKTELEKAQEKLAEAEARATQAEARRVEALKQNAVYAEATKVGIKPALAWKLVDLAAIEINADEVITGADGALKALVKEYPELQQKPRGDLDASKGGSGEKQIAQMSENEVQEWANIYGVPLEDAKAALRAQGRL